MMQVRVKQDESKDDLETKLKDIYNEERRLGYEHDHIIIIIIPIIDDHIIFNILKMIIIIVIGDVVDNKIIITEFSLQL